MRPFQYTNIIFVVLLIAGDLCYLGGILEWWWLLILLLAYIHMLVLGAIYIQWNFYLQSFNKGKKEKQIALTFDDGPATETAAILDILKQQGVEAAFFTIGKHAIQHPGILKRWHEEGHIIGNHSYHHGFSFDWLPAGKMAAEIEETNRIIENLTGKKPLLFRPPYGVTNPNLFRAVKRTGMQSIGWSLRSFDTRARSPQQLLTRLFDRLQDGDIILLHDSMPVTREILTDFISTARKNGFTFARVDKLLDIDAYA